MGDRVEPLRLDERDAVLREQVVEHLRVLPGDGGAEDGEGAGREAKIDGEAVDVTGARAGAGAEDHLVSLEIGDDLVDERADGGTPAVHDALAADLYDVHPREDGVVGRRQA